jgi:uncharacterized protein (DUF305 family)
MIVSKSKLLGLLLVGSSWGMVACSANTAANPVNTPVAVAKEQQGGHGGMNHGSGSSHNMDLGPANANYDLRFIDAMVPHHQGAVVMAKAALPNSKRPEIIKLAKSIIAAQDQEVSQMQKWRKQWYPKASATAMMWHAEANHEMPMTEEYRKMMQMDVDLGAADAQFDRRFLVAMIPHHQGAVTMAQDLAKKSKRPEMQKLAKGIIASQQQEISQMQRWQQQWYPKS